MPFTPFREKMEHHGISSAAIRAFEYAFAMLERKETGLIPEGSIRPVQHLPALDSLGSVVPEPTLIARTVVLKLNGGLGTGMGLEKAKSLLPVREGCNFLDLTVRQLRAMGTDRPRFLLLNSFSTSADTLGHLARDPELGDPRDLELMQNKVPKIDAATLQPVHWPEDPALEWCPPGHGDLYAAISGMLPRLLDAGYRYLFVSNADNLGATLDLRILTWFAQSDASFAMEVTRRTAADRKGGHLAEDATTGHLLLRESAQCPEEDMVSFQEVERHRYFNTNNLWIRLDRLAQMLEVNSGFIPLPMIANRKTVNPRDASSPQVIQLETAMGAAIACFPDATALEVPRDRFSPVKTTADLLALRSDAYAVTPDGRVVLAESRRGVPPAIDLDSKHYKLVDQLDAACPDGVPSLIECEQLTVRGPVQFASGTAIRGCVELINDTPDRVLVGPELKGSK